MICSLNYEVDEHREGNRTRSRASLLPRRKVASNRSLHAFERLRWHDMVYFKTTIVRTTPIGITTNTLNKTTNP